LFSFGFFAAICVLIFITPATFGSEAPAWVQAIGSIVAILVAVFVPYLQRHTETEDRRRQEALVARSFGTVMLRELTTFKGRIERDRKCARSAGPTEIVSIQKDTIPQDIWDNGERLHQLGTAGHHVLLAMNAVRLARENLTGGRLSPTDGAADRFRHHIEIARVECDTAICELKKVLDV